jgi:FkbM family methyltransferase
MDSYNSQSGEVQWVLENVPLPPKGCFVDVGANDGVTDSNTYWLEKQGWNGICVEPDPRLTRTLRANRDAKTTVLALAAGSDIAATFYLADLPAWSGTTPPKGHSEPYTVAMNRLDAILESCGYKQVDLLSIDTEGTELEVLQTIDLQSYSPAVIIVEWDSQSRENGDHEQEIREYMAKQPYDCAAKIGANLIFVRRENAIQK